jgi:2,3-bisphosphoglycerate-independent phosphoglycerate mutase
MQKRAEQMKYVVMVGDGMADYPVESLGGKTPLMAARTVHMDWLASRGELGLVKTVPDGFTPGSEIANLAIFGYDPARFYTGRGPLEAGSLGVRLGPDEIAFRCNLVHVAPNGAGLVMKDFSAGHITDAESRVLIADLNSKAGSHDARFYAGVSYRHLLVMRTTGGETTELEHLDLAPPHDITDKEISEFLPAPKGAAERVLRLTAQSQRVLARHPINLAREAKGLPPANSIWLWGQGRSPKMIGFKERFGIQGCVISAVHLLKGIAAYAGLESLDVPGATGYFDTDYDAKARYALEGLKENDFAYIHVEAPDEAGHMGDVGLKVGAIEAFDEKIVGAVLKGLKRFGRYKVMILPDHPTPISLRTHAADPVPYVIYSGGGVDEPIRSRSFDEVSARASGIVIEKGYELIERFLDISAGGAPHQ